MNPQISAETEIFALFAVVLLAVSAFAYSPAINPHNTTSPNQQTFSKPTNVIIYVLYIAVGGATLAFLLKYEKFFKELYKNHKVLFKRLIGFSLLISFAISLLFDFVLTLEATAALVIVFGIIFVSYEIYKRFFKNLNKNWLSLVVAILFAAILGEAFTFKMALLFFLLMAIYDFIAVFITKHMLILAKKLQTPFSMYIARRIYGVPIAQVPKEYQAEEKLQTSDYILVSHSNDYKITHVVSENIKQKITKIKNEGKFPMATMVGLGSGDFLIPAIVLFAALRISFFYWIVTFIGLLLGLIVTFALLNKLKRPLPALPTIGIGLLITMVFLWIY